MGWMIDGPYVYNMKVKAGNFHYCIPCVKNDFNDFQIKESFDWAFKVIEKIESLNIDGSKTPTTSKYKRFNVIVRDSILIYEGSSQLMVKNDKSKIENLWNAIIEFIDYYNKPKKPKKGKISDEELKKLITEETLKLKKKKKKNE